MPSWKLHRRICEKLHHEVKEFASWTPELLDKIDRIIDTGGEHDVGRKLEPQSFWKMLTRLWLEFGDVYDATGRSCLNPNNRFERQKWLNKWSQEWLSGNIFSDSLRNTWIYIPDDVIILATLHHLLDLCMEVLREYRFRKSDAHLMIEYADRFFKDSFYVNELRKLTTTDGRSFQEVYERLIEILKERAEQIYEMLAAELRDRGTPIGYKPLF